MVTVRDWVLYTHNLPRHHSIHIPTTRQDLAMGNWWDGKVTDRESGSTSHLWHTGPYHKTWHSLNTRSTRVFPIFLFSQSVFCLLLLFLFIHGPLLKPTPAYPFNTHLGVLPGPALQGWMWSAVFSGHGTKSSDKSRAQVQDLAHNSPFPTNVFVTGHGEITSAQIPESPHPISLPCY